MKDRQKKERKNTIENCTLFNENILVLLLFFTIVHLFCLLFRLNRTNIGRGRQEGGKTINLRAWNFNKQKKESSGEKKNKKKKKNREREKERKRGVKRERKAFPDVCIVWTSIVVIMINICSYMFLYTAMFCHKQTSFKTILKSVSLGGFLFVCLFLFVF